MAGENGTKIRCSKKVVEGAEIIENGSELAFVTKSMTFAEAEKLEASVKAAGCEVKSRIAVLDI